MLHQRVFDALTADSEDLFGPAAPDQAPGFGQRIVINDVDGENLVPVGYPSSHRRVRHARLHRGEVDQADLQVGLGGEVAREVGLLHRGDGMARHDRVAVKAEDALPRPGEEVSEGLIAADRGRAGDQWRPAAAENLAPDFGRCADRADIGRGIESRADLVMRDRRAKRGERPEGARQMRAHPVRAFGPGDARDADRLKAGIAREGFGARRVQKHGGVEPGEAQHLHHCGGAGEIVTVECQEGPGHHPLNRLSARRRGPGGQRRNR